MLELLIVLSIMVAMAAVAWPNLRRPIADTAVQQAAGQLREQIAICKNAAAIKGQPLLMRIEAGKRSVQWGDWKQLIADQLEPTSSQSALPDESEAADSELTKFQSIDLPPDVVVDDVRLDTQTYVPDSQNASSEPTTETSIDNESKRWYLPFLPNGQSRDAVIVLRDVASGSRVALKIDAVPGMMSTSRVSSAYFYSVNSDEAANQDAQATLDPPSQLDSDPVEVAPIDGELLP